MKKTFIKIMRERIENWVYILKTDPTGDMYDTQVVENALTEDKCIIRDMADALSHTKGFNRNNFYRDCGMFLKGYMKKE